MKILHIVYSMSLKTGGLAVAVRGLSKTLAERGHSVSIYTTDKLEDNGHQGMEDCDGYKIYRFPGRSFCTFSCSPELKRQLINNISDFDIIHIHGLWVYTTYISAKICQKLNKPYIITTHGMLDNWSFHQGYLKKLIYSKFIEQKNINKAKAVHFTSEKEKTRSKHFGIKAPQVVIPLGIDEKEFIFDGSGDFESGPVQLNGKRFILFFGRLHSKKGLELLIRAFKRLSTEFMDLKLVIMGSGEDIYVNKIKGLIKKEDLFDKIHIIDSISGRERFDVVRKAEFVCLPSKQENFGMVLIESLASKTPVVTSRDVDLSEDIKKYKAGIITDCSVEAVYDACKILLSDKKLRSDMGENGKRWVFENFKWPDIINRFEKLYEQCL